MKTGKSVRLWSRNRNDLSKRFPRLVAALASLPIRDCILDGEIVCLSLDGKPSFEDLQNVRPGRDAFCHFYSFNLLHLEDRSLCSLPFVERKKRLAELLSGCQSCLRISEALQANPDDLVAFCEANKLEGLLAKKCDSIYLPGQRSASWVKFKTYQRGEFLIGGFLPGEDGVEGTLVGFWREREFR